ncbi:hypothetical protein JYA59_20480 [Vibrio neptunius]|nr:hypothetical protein [Vibrio neptunius]
MKADSLDKILFFSIQSKEVLVLKKYFLLVLCLFPSIVFSSTAFKTYVSGEVYDITSTRQGLLIRVDEDKVPTDCNGVNPSGWMLIKKENQTMISVALAMRAQGKRMATVYIDGVQDNFCTVSQYDPHD